MIFRNCFIVFITILPIKFSLGAGVVTNFLNTVKVNAIDYKIVELEKKSQKLNIEKSLSSYDTYGFLRGELLDSEDVAFSPFSSDSTKTTQYSLGLSKKWPAGIESSINYSLVDSFRTFPRSNDVDYYSPDINISLKTDIIRDLIYGESRNEMKAIESKAMELNVEEKIEKKALLVNSLLLLSDILEVDEEIVLQTNLCKQISKQVRKLKQKSQRGSVAKKDYYLSLKDLNSCKASTSLLENRLNENKEQLSVSFGVDFKDLQTVKIDSLYSEVVSLYSGGQYSADKVDYNNQQELMLIKRQLSTLSHNKKKLRAGNKLPLSFELKFGRKGLQSEFSDSHDDIIDRTNPYVQGIVELQFPFTNRNVRSDLKINQWQEAILNKKIVKQNNSARLRFKTLSNNLDRNIKIYESYKTNVKLAQSVLREAQKDFNNGRIDFYNLSEFQKGLIQSQNQLGSIRIKIIQEVLEYLDYFNFFDRYY